MLKKVFGSAVFGVDATTITVEVNVDKGIGYHLVGLPDNAIKESNYRIAAALQNNGYKIPGKKITINMAPADLRKEGSAYDLTLAIGILAASNQIQADNLEDFLIMGELSLDGGLQPIRGALPIAVKAKKEGYKGFILPSQNDISLGACLKRKRLEFEWTQEYIADFFDIGKDCYQNFEWKRYVPHIKNRKKVNTFLGFNFWDDGRNSLSNQVLLYRIEKSITMSELAKEINVSCHTIERIEKEEKHVSVSMSNKVNDFMKSDEKLTI